MSRFEYTLTLLTIFAGLIFAEILADVMAVVKALDHETFYLLPVLLGRFVVTFSAPVVVEPLAVATDRRD